MPAAPIPVSPRPRVHQKAHHVYNNKMKIEQMSFHRYSYFGAFPSVHFPIDKSLRKGDKVKTSEASTSRRLILTGQDEKQAH
jgi:hypothetical protein